MIFSESLNINSLYIIVLIALIIGALLFFLSCFIHVKKGYTAIIEKMEVYYGTYKSGFYLFAPFVYRRVGMYKNEPTEFEVSVCDKIIRIKVQIIDFKEYHYAHKYYGDLVNDLQNNHYESIDQYINNLQELLISIGCSLVK